MRVLKALPHILPSRDGSYGANALRCDVWVVCACTAVCIVLVSLVFGEVFFGGSASLHDLFLHFLAKCFFYNLFWGVFFWKVINV